MPAPKGNQYAAKEGETATSHLHCRIKPSEKAFFVKAAQASDMKLCEFITKACMEKAKNIIDNNQ